MIKSYFRKVSMSREFMKKCSVFNMAMKALYLVGHYKQYFGFVIDFPEAVCSMGVAFTRKKN